MKTKFQKRLLLLACILISVQPILFSQEQYLISDNVGHAWVNSGTDSTIHIVYYSTIGSKAMYRFGKSISKLSNEIEIPGTDKFDNPRVDVADDGTVHIAFQKGTFSEATSSWYTCFKNDSFITPERFADTSEIDGAPRAYLPDVAADSAGNVLVSFWSVDDGGDRAYYRWRDKDGNWGEIKTGLSTFHAATPKVEEYKGKFYLFYGESDYVKNISGPVEFGADFNSGTSVNSNNLGLSIQNEGQNFAISSKGEIVAAGNVRKTFYEGVGVWVSMRENNLFVPEYLGTFDNAVRGDESGFHPVIAFDEYDGSIYVSVTNRADKLSYYVYYKNGEWSSYLRLRPEADDEQGDLRTGPSLADVPGEGVLALYKGGTKLYARYLYLDSLANEPGTVSNIINQYGETGVLIYPNPLVSGNLSVETNSLETKIITITNIFGALLWENKTKESKVYIDNAVFPAKGAYILTIKNKGKVVGSKIMFTGR